jgi:hypothetical protein
VVAWAGWGCAGEVINNGDKSAWAACCFLGFENCFLWNVVLIPIWIILLHEIPIYEPVDENNQESVLHSRYSRLLTGKSSEKDYIFDSPGYSLCIYNQWLRTSITEEERQE